MGEKGQAALHTMDWVGSVGNFIQGGVDTGQAVVHAVAQGVANDFATTPQLTPSQQAADQAAIQQAYGNANAGAAPNAGTQVSPTAMAPTPQPTPQAGEKGNMQEASATQIAGQGSALAGEVSRGGSIVSTGPQGSGTAAVDRPAPGASSTPNTTNLIK